MKVKLRKFALGLLAAMMLMATAMPAVSDEHDRPDEVPPDEPVAETEDPQGADEGGVGADPHGETGDFDDFVSIRNETGTGLSRLNLNTTDSQVINEDTWRLANNADTGNFEISEGGTTTRAVMEQGGNLGLGIEDPLSPLHIERSGGFQLRMEGSGADYRMDAFGTSLRIGDSSNSNQFRIFGADAPTNALTVANGVGIGTSAPSEALHITNIRDANATNLRIENGGNHWINGVNDAGHFLFLRSGTGGLEFRVRERNHAFATIDVEGPVRATAFNTSSSSEFKTEPQAVDPRDVLDGLNALPVSTWQFKDCADGEGRLGTAEGAPTPPCSGQGQGPTHIGPMAEDFQAQFGLGDGESISTVDADGVIMASIQGLTQLVEEKDARIAELEGEVADLESRFDALEAQVNGDNGGNNGNPGRGGPTR